MYIRLSTTAAAVALTVAAFFAVHPAEAHRAHTTHHAARSHGARTTLRASENFDAFVAPHGTLWWDHSGSAFGRSHAENAPRYTQREARGTRTVLGPRPRAWCGWFMRKLLGVADASYNLARNWAHWGRGGAPGIGAVVVWPHHVGKIVGRSGGQWVIESGNDGHAVRTRPRSVRGAIAFRWG